MFGSNRRFGDTAALGGPVNVFGKTGATGGRRIELKRALRLSGASFVDRKRDGGVWDATMIDAIPPANRRLASASHVVGETEPRLEIVLIEGKLCVCSGPNIAPATFDSGLGTCGLGSCWYLPQTEVQRQAR